MPKILILSSNPRRDLNLDREVSDLTTAVQRLGKFEIGLGLGVRSQELPELLIEHSPQIVHFCGHGAGEQGLVFQDEHGRERLVSTEILAEIFETFTDEVNCVVLNACDSDRQSEAIVAHINYVVGMSQPILDQAAHIFAVGFYKSLAAGKSVEQAYKLGCLAIRIWSEDNSQSAQSSRHRKAEYVGVITQPTHPKLPEHLKLVLRKKSLLPSSATESNLVQEVIPQEVIPSTAPPDLPLTLTDELIEQNVDREEPAAEIHVVQPDPPSSALPDLPSEFEAVVRQEIDRKEYKDQARAAYDNFGQFSAEQAAELTKAEYVQRKILIGKVKEFWIEGFLKPSLQGDAALSLDLKSRPDEIAELSQGIEALSVELDDSFEELRETRIYEEMGQGRTLLILGNPGAGKTIALLQLAQRLIERSEQNLSLPMPIVFNLSSWAKDRKTIVDWLIDELLEKYQVPKSLSEPWIRQQQIIPLLDGLDEVNADYRNDCVRALNEFIGLFPQTEVAVCSRVRDYEALNERLQISSALCLQPLSPKQVYEFLDSVGGSLAGLKALLKSDAGLEQFAETPLILNLMSSAYQGWSVEKLMDELRSAPDRNQHLLDIYIDRRLELDRSPERGITSGYSKNKVLRWLSWLSIQMVQEKQTVFLIEKMQPSWLRNNTEERAYQVRNFMVAGLGVGLIVGFVDGLSTLTLPSTSTESLDFKKAFILSDMLAVGLSSSLIAGTIAGLSKEILLLEKLGWSWQRAKSRLVSDSLASFGSGFIFGLMLRLLYTLSPGTPSLTTVLQSNTLLVFGLTFGLFGVLLGALLCGLGGTEVENRTVPNQGIRSSCSNALIIGLCSTLLIGLIFWELLDRALGQQFFGGLIFQPQDGLILGTIIGLILGLKYGGVACIQHYNLRQMLHQKGRMPQNYARFLDFASDRLLMKKSGVAMSFFTGCC